MNKTMEILTGMDTLVVWEGQSRDESGEVTSWTTRVAGRYGRAVIYRTVRGWGGFVENIAQGCMFVAERTGEHAMDDALNAAHDLIATHYGMVGR